ncbi:MAG: nickel-dependent hydrogenase large subunit [Candidatus Schekmanbacteria bacterium]|nr:nickel-dependent hydrogenase large subunit [Candidatus Schekmanbacteria bacterium]
MGTLNVKIPVNRVEGDLEIRLEISNGVVTNAWSIGTMFRGFERLLVGRAARDAIVITPRICGLCSTAHQAAAVRALEAACALVPPDNAIRLRNIALMTELIQSDIRQAILMFAVDFTNPSHRRLDGYDEAIRRYLPLRGSAAIETLQHTRHLIEIAAMVAGQWPHSTFMVPGGVVSQPGVTTMIQCREVLRSFQAWYEQQMLGCSLSRFAAIASSADLDAWLGEKEAHRRSHVGFFLQFGRAAGIDRLGRGYPHFLSFGSLELPADTRVVGTGGKLVPSGFVRATEASPLDTAKVTEHVAHSWFEDYTGGKHPAEGETNPTAIGDEGPKYSWCKAPRYDGLPAETGPLAERLVARDPLFCDLVQQQGASALVRELARLVRPATLLPAMADWIEESCGSTADDFYVSPGAIANGEGAGLLEAARGALGHWVRLRDGRIDHYQIITPTAWHASPRDANGAPGPWEQALLGTPIADPEEPVAAGYVLRSFDPCLVCSVHTLERGRHLARVRLG